MVMASSRLLRILLFLGLLGLALFQLRLALIAQTSYSGLTPSKAVRKYQTQPRLLVAYGREALFNQGSLQTVEQWYRRALVANPFYVPAWIALAELRNDEGESDRARAILTYVNGLMLDIARWRWDKAMLAYQLNRIDIVARDLSWLTGEEKTSYQTRQKAIKLAFSLWPEPDKLVEAMGTDNIVPLFRQAVRAKNLAAAAYIWPILEQTTPDTALVLPYINLLISSKDIQKAARIWQTYFPSKSLLYNGSFSAPLAQSGFGWRTGKVKGATAEPAADKGGGTGLHLHFDGTDNVKYHHTRQFIALEPGQSYLLSGKFQSRNLSTDQRPFVEVTGLYCSMPAVAAAMMPGNQEWSSFSLTFTVPEQCSGVQVRLRRKASNDLDNKISGDVWLTDFALRKTEHRPDA